jgi:hypothetical protein
MAISFVNKGTFASGAGDINPGIPASMQAGDLMILVVESANQAITAPTSPQTWTQVTNSPQSTGTAAAAGGVRLGVFYRWWVSGDGAPTVTDTGDHQTGIIIGLRGVDATTPFDATPAGNVTTPANASVSFPAITTVTANAWIVHCFANDRDANASGSLSSVTNAALSSITVQHDQVVNTGAGGGVAVITATKASAGSTGNTTATNAASVTNAMLTIALRPAAPVHTNTGAPAAAAATVAGTAAHLTLHTSSGAPAADSATVAGTAAHLTLHASSGALAADAATVAGTSVHAGVATGGESVRVDTSSLISGAVVVGDRGHGVLGSEVPSTGEHGAGLLYNDITLPDEAGDEFRALITSVPVGLTLFVYEDSSFEASGADGTYVGEYEGFKNGVSYGTAEFTITIGETGAHATSGALAAAAATVVGTAAHEHAATGALTAGSATAAGTATHFTLHATSGAIAAAAATVAGTAAHEHAATGALVAASGEVSGTAARLALHTTSGAIAAGAATVSGSAAHHHAATGAVAASAAEVAGSAQHLTLHATSGALSAGSATASAAAAHEHAATGALAAASAEVSVAAAHLTLHATSGAIAAGSATASGSAAHEHAAAGALVAGSATVDGDADLSVASAEHDASGDLAAGAADVDGTAAHLTLHETTGDLASGAATVSGSAFQAHDTTGALAAQAATVDGAATHPHVASGALASQAATAEGTAAHLTLHTTSGALVADSATVAGSAVRTGGHVTEGNLSAQAASVVGAAAVSVAGGLSPRHAALLEALARLHGLVDPLTVSATGRSDGTVVQTVSQVGDTVTITTVAAPSGDEADDPLTAQQAAWLEGLARLHGLIDPLSVTATSRGDGTVQQTISTVGGTTTVATL